MADPPVLPPFYRPPIKIEQCFIAIKQWRWWQTAGGDFVMDVKKLWRLIDPSLPPLKTVPQMDRQLIGRHANLPIITLMINYLLTMIESFQPIPCENTSRSKSASKTTKPLQRRLKDLSKHL